MSHPVPAPPSPSAQIGLKAVPESSREKVAEAGEAEAGRPAGAVAERLAQLAQKIANWETNPPKEASSPVTANGEADTADSRQTASATSGGAAGGAVAGTAGTSAPPDEVQIGPVLTALREIYTQLESEMKQVTPEH